MSQIVDVLIEHERMGNLPPHGEALFVGEARLLDIHIHVAYRLGDSHRFVLHPAGIGVGHQAVARLEFGGDSENPVDIHIRITADL